MVHKEADFLKWDFFTLSQQFKSKQISPLEVTRAILQRIKALNPQLNAYLTLMEESALADAKKAEEDISSGNVRGVLHGVPVGLKDLIYTKGVKTTMGSEIYKDYIPPYNATVVDRLSGAGAIIIGKLNTHEFAYGPTGDVSYFGPVKNPYDLTRVSGGSSSGSGAAVSAGLCYGALGTDTGGSIRIPSSACGIVGMKPTFGRVSKYGVFPLAYTLDHVGSMTRTIRDNALLLNELVGFDGNDPYSIQSEQEDFTRNLDKGIKDTIIGVPTSYYFELLDDEVRRGVEEAISQLRKHGAKIVDVDIDLGKAAWSQLMTIRSEAYAVHREHMEEEEKERLLHPDVRDRLIASKPTAGYEYVKAQNLRKEVIAAFQNVFRKVHAIIAPTLTVLPPKIGQREVVIQDQKEHVYSALLRLNGPANLTGLPSLSVPCGFSKGGLPIGLQLIGNHGEEAGLYQIGYALEQIYQLPTLKWTLDE